jgi:arylsulfatase A-like enzyme
MVQNIDYAPTFLDFAGVDIPKEIQGKSLKPLLTGEKETEWRDAIYYHYYEYPNEHMVVRHYGIRTDRYKLIHFYDKIYDGWELYDLENDPGEMRNIYNDKNYKMTVIELKDKLSELQIEYKDLDRSTY